MPLYTPFWAQLFIETSLRDAIFYPYEYAANAAKTIVDTIDDAVTAGVAEARGYTDSASERLVSQVDNELNQGFGMYDAVIAAREDIIDAKIDQIQSMIDTVNITSNTETDENIINAYESIAQSHEQVGSYLEETLETVSSAMGDMYSFVGDSVNKAVENVDTNLTTAIKAIIDIPQSMIDKAKDTLLPALSMSSIANVNKILFSSPVSGFVTSIFTNLKGTFGDVLTINEDEAEKWASKGLDIMNKIAGAMLKEEKTHVSFIRK